MKGFVRFAALAGVVSAAAAAHAFQFSVLSIGTEDGSTFIDSETVIGQSGTPATLQDLTMNVNTGVGEYTSSNGNLDFNFVLGSAIPENNGFYFEASWTYGNTSTGAWANLIGGGTFAYGIDNFSANIWQSNTGLVGNLTSPAPEPVSFAILGASVLALRRRRRRA